MPGVVILYVLATRFSNADALFNSCNCIKGVRICHRLDANRIMPSQRNISNMDNPGFEAGISGKAIAVFMIGFQ